MNAIRNLLCIFGFVALTFLGIEATANAVAIVGRWRANRRG